MFTFLEESIEWQNTLMLIEGWSWVAFLVLAAAAITVVTNWNELRALSAIRAAITDTASTEGASATIFSFFGWYFVTFFLLGCYVGGLAALINGLMAPFYFMILWKLVPLKRKVESLTSQEKWECRLFPLMAIVMLGLMILGESWMVERYFLILTLLSGLAYVPQILIIAKRTELIYCLPPEALFTYVWTTALWVIYFACAEEWWYAAAMLFADLELIFIWRKQLQLQRIAVQQTAEV